MFGLLSSTQIYGLQQAHEQHNNINNINNIKQQRSSLNLSETACGKESYNNNNSTSNNNKFFATLSSMQSIKAPTNFIEKFIKSDLLSGYDTIRNYKNFQHNNNKNGNTTTNYSNSTFFTAHNSGGGGNSGGANKQSHSNSEGLLNSFNCLQGSYRSNCDGEFYEAVNVNSQQQQRHKSTATTADMTIKCSKNLLASPPDEQSPATLQNYQKLPECEQDLLLTPSSGASSGEFNSDVNLGTSLLSTPVSSLYKRLSFGGRGSKQTETALNVNENVSDYSSSNSNSSSSVTNTSASLSNKSIDLQRTSSASSSGDCANSRERKKSAINAMLAPLRQVAEHATTTTKDSNNGAKTNTPTPTHVTSERAQRRKLLQMISQYELQQKQLQHELAMEKRRRNEELTRVGQSLLFFESKLKRDMKLVNQRLLEKDTEICRLVQQNRALRKRLAKLAEVEGDNARDEGVVEDGEAETETDEQEEAKELSVSKLESALENDDKKLLEDCLVLEALQCINCKRQFYDIELKEGWTQTNPKDGSRNKDDHTTEHGSSSDDTVSSSFYGARRSVRYTSKRTSGTFRDYMRSRSMNIDDPALDQNSEENTSTISRDDSQTSYEKMNVYSRTIERMHGVKSESERESSELSGVETMRSVSRASNKSNNSSKPQIEEDDGIFSPTQDDDFEEPELEGERSIKIVTCRSEFSEASPKQVYETSTDDWYASASDQEEIGATTAATKSYAHGAVNPVLECVNQILLQQSMEDALHERSNSKTNETAKPHPKTPTTPAPALLPAANLPRRSSLSGRRSSRSNSRSSDGQSSRNGTLTRKRVHFSTKNSMVHVPRNDEHDEEDEDDDDEAASAEALHSNSNAQLNNEMISTLATYNPMNYFVANATTTTTARAAATAARVGGSMLTEVSEQERLETLNYESIYSNEYEPIGSEHNSSNLYVDMESTSKMTLSNSSATGSVTDGKLSKMPPALPPKPANLLKFKKSLQQLDELPDEHLHQDCDASVTTANTSEPDYCSISEVNMGMKSVQIVADVHKAPESEADRESTHSLEAATSVAASELDAVEVSTVASDDTCAASQKTDEIEEIFADIPKLPNVAAIIAPKHAKQTPITPQKQQQTPTGKLQKSAQQQNDYLLMAPKVETPNTKLQHARNATILNTSSHLGGSQQKSQGINNTNNTAISYNTAKKATPKLQLNALKLQLHTPNPIQQLTPQQQQQQQQSQYKRKHMPNILAEINKRISQPNSPTTPTKPTLTPTKPQKPTNNALLLKSLESSTTPSMPLQAEFDWYNLDAEYGKAALPPHDLSLKSNDMLNGGNSNSNGNSNMLAEIHEDHESIVTTADEYNLDEEFSLTCDKQDNESNDTQATELCNDAEQQKLMASAALSAAICEAVKFPMFSENTPPTLTATNTAKAKKIKKNLANFEKFIEGSGLSNKPLPSKRKIYFAGPFV